jgi:hypothetical protein
MQSTHIITPPANQVSALFADRALSFDLTKGATFAELAERLSDMCEWHTGAPTAISLKFRGEWRMAGIHQPGA